MSHEISYTESQVMQIHPSKYCVYHKTNANFRFPQIERLFVEWSQYNTQYACDNQASDEESTDGKNDLPTGSREFQLAYVRSLSSGDRITLQPSELLATKTPRSFSDEMLNRTICDIETKLTPYFIQSNGSKGSNGSNGSDNANGANGRKVRTRDPARSNQKFEETFYFSAIFS